jgi:hypothetical protein
MVWHGRWLGDASKMVVVWLLSDRAEELCAFARKIGRPLMDCKDTLSCGQQKKAMTWLKQASFLVYSNKGNGRWWMPQLCRLAGI